jgi:hypothetical protein
VQPARLSKHGRRGDRSPIRDIRTCPPWRVIRGSPSLPFVPIYLTLRMNFFKIFENFAAQFPEKEVEGCFVDSN